LRFDCGSSFSSRAFDEAVTGIIVGLVVFFLIWILNMVAIGVVSRRRGLNPLPFVALAFFCGVFAWIGVAISQPDTTVVVATYGTQMPAYAPGPYGNSVPNPYGNAPPNFDGNAVPNPYGNAPPNFDGNAVPNPYGSAPPNFDGNAVPNPYGSAPPNFDGNAVPNPYGNSDPNPYGNPHPNPPATSPPPHSDSTPMLP
jgi:hypothetical protein